MSTVERITVTLTAEMADTVRGAVAAGEYASASEIVREALRDWRHRRILRQRELDDLRGDLRKGAADIEAGRVSDFDPDDIIASGERRSRGAASG